MQTVVKYVLKVGDMVKKQVRFNSVFGGVMPILDSWDHCNPVFPPIGNASDKYGPQFSADHGIMSRAVEFVIFRKILMLWQNFAKFCSSWEMADD